MNLPPKGGIYSVRMETMGEAENEWLGVEGGLTICNRAERVHEDRRNIRCECNSADLEGKGFQQIPTTHIADDLLAAIANLWQHWELIQGCTCGEYIEREEGILPCRS